jgi:hypothetical protein
MFGVHSGPFWKHSEAILSSFGQCLESILGTFGSDFYHHSVNVWNLSGSDFYHHSVNVWNLSGISFQIFVNRNYFCPKVKSPESVFDSPKVKSPESVFDSSKVKSPKSILGTLEPILSSFNQCSEAVFDSPKVKSPEAVFDSPKVKSSESVFGICLESKGHKFGSSFQIFVNRNYFCPKVKSPEFILGTFGISFQ